MIIQEGLLFDICATSNSKIANFDGPIEVELYEGDIIKCSILNMYFKSTRVEIEDLLKEQIFYIPNWNIKKMIRK